MKILLCVKYSALQIPRIDMIAAFCCDAQRIVHHSIVHCNYFLENFYLFDL